MACSLEGIFPEELSPTFSVTYIEKSSCRTRQVSTRSDLVALCAFETPFRVAPARSASEVSRRGDRRDVAFGPADRRAREVIAVTG